MTSDVQGAKRRADRGGARHRERKASVAEAVSFRTPRNPRDMAVRKAQLDSFVRLVPATILTQLVVAAVLVAVFSDTVDSLSLGL